MLLGLLDRPHLAFVLLLLGHLGVAQSISGTIENVPNAIGSALVLTVSHGYDHIPIDSVVISTKGRFAFRKGDYPAGFYQLAHGADRLDLILGTGEEKLELQIAGTPFQEHLIVSRSVENQRLWDYKRASRNSQDRLRSVKDQRAEASPRDSVLLKALSVEEAEIQTSQQAYLDRLLAQDPKCVFNTIVLADRQLMGAIEHGTKAIRDSVPWSNSTLVRSAVYPKAIMALLQSATPATPDVLMAASDSVLAWAAPDSTCWRFARGMLVDLFITYGPPDVVQHLVDRYVAGPDALLPPEDRLVAAVSEQLKVAIGSVSPDVLLPDPIRLDTIHLHDLAEKKLLTVLFVYSSTCDHCHEQMPGLNAIHRKYLSKQVQVVGLALDSDTAEFVGNIKKMGLEFRCFSELAAWGSPAAKAFAIKATPAFVVIDQSGKIIGKPHDHVELEEFLAGKVGI